MLDHIILSVSDLTKSVEFYERALAPLGISHYVDFDGENGHPDLKGFGRDSRAFLWLKLGERSATAVHFGFVAESRAAVDAFYEADVLDPDGYSVEVVIKH